MNKSSNTGFSKLSDTAEDRVREMLLLAERVRESHGSDLDDNAIMAVAEATGTEPDYVRLAIQMLPEKRQTGLLGRMRASFFALDPDVRRYVSSAYLSAMLALMLVLSAGTKDQYGLCMMAAYVIGAVGIFNIGLCRDSRSAAATGAIFGGLFVVSVGLFSAVSSAFGMSVKPLDAFWLIPFTVGFALLAPGLRSLAQNIRRKIGLKDRSTERQELLSQLVELQDKLRSNQQSMTFLNIDIVGSTKMKNGADPLAVEFTFAEFHKFVDSVVRKHGGTVHSTAGDGANLVFDNPQSAFAAAKNIQGGLFELNTMRNKIGVPITLRAGIHTGDAHIPDPENVSSVTFAQVIDIAAHMQDAAPPGGVVVSESAAAFIPGGVASIGTDRVLVDGCYGVVWQPRSAILMGAKALAPPTPELN